MSSTIVRPKTVRAVGYARSATTINTILMWQIASIRRFCTEMNYRLLAAYSDYETGRQEHNNHQALYAKITTSEVVNDVYHV